MTWGSERASRRRDWPAERRRSQPCADLEERIPDCGASMCKGPEGPVCFRRPGVAGRKRERRHGTDGGHRTRIWYYSAVTMEPAV